MAQLMHDYYSIVQKTIPSITHERAGNHTRMNSWLHHADLTIYVCAWRSTDIAQNWHVPNCADLGKPNFSSSSNDCQLSYLRRCNSFRERSCYRIDFGE